MSISQQPHPPHSVCLIDKQRIQAALDDLAARLNRHFAGRQVVVLCVMNGGLVFTGQLIPRLTFDIRLDYCHATRYRNTTAGHELEWQAEPGMALQDETVLILDDILDEGYTLAAIIDYCRGRQAAEVVSAVLLDKQHERRYRDLQADFAALSVEDRYVFGFGMDYEGGYRHLDAIYAFDETSGDD